MNNFEVKGDIEIVKFDGVTSSAVYLGGVGRLDRITNRLEWHTEYVNGLDMDVSSLTLDEIYEQVAEKFEHNLITVFVNDPLSGKVYQCNNYEDGKWVLYGELRGYA